MLDRLTPLFLFALVSKLVVAAPPTYPAPTPRQLFNPYWTISNGYQSTFQLHNNLVDKSFSVQPVLLSPDGKGTKLQAIELGPMGNASINVQEALSQAGNISAGWGSAVFEYSSSYPGSISVETSVTQPSKTLVYTITGAEQGASASDLHAVYWVPPGQAEIYIALQNMSSATIHISATLEGAGPGSPFASVTLGPNQSQVLTRPIGSADTSPDQTGDQYGAVRLVHDGPDGALNTSGWVENDDVGYSNMMTFYDPGRHGGTTLFGTQVFLGEQTDLLASGKPLRINSYLVLLNTSATALVVEGDLAYKSNGQITHVPLAVGTLAPYQSTEVVLSKFPLPRDASIGSIRLSYAGPDAALMGRVFGIADDLTFGFYSALESSTYASFDEIYWTTAGDASSVLTVTNFGSMADNITVMLTYNGGTFSLPTFSMESLETATVNVRDWQTKLPANVDYGGFRIFATSGRSRMLAKEHVISEQERTAAPFYGSYPYAMNFWLDPSSFSEVPSSSDQVHGIVQYTDNSEYYDYGGSITSGDTSVITVGTQSNVWPFWYPLTGQSAGSTTLDAVSDSYPCDPTGTYYCTLMASATATTCDFTVSPGNQMICSGSNQLFGANPSGTCIIASGDCNYPGTYSVGNGNNMNIVTSSCNVQNNISANGHMTWSGTLGGVSFQFNLMLKASSGASAKGPVTHTTRQTCQ